MDQTTPSQPPAAAPQSTSSLDDILASIEQQTGMQSTPTAPVTPPPTTPPAAPVTPSVPEPVAPPAPPAPAPTPAPEPKPLAAVPGSNEPPAAPLAPEEATNRTGTPFDLHEHQITTPGKPVPPPAPKAAPAPVAETPTFEKKPDAPAQQTTPPTAPPKKSGGMNIKMAVGIVVFVLMLVGSAAGFYLFNQSQDLRQKATESCGKAGVVKCGEGCPDGKGMKCQNDGTWSSCVNADACGYVGDRADCSTNEQCWGLGYTSDVVCSNGKCTNKNDPTKTFVGCSTSGGNKGTSFSPNASGCYNCYRESLDSSSGAVSTSINCYRESTSCGSKVECQGDSGGQTSSGGTQAGGTCESTGGVCFGPTYNGVNVENCGSVGRSNGSGTCSNGQICCGGTGGGGGGGAPQPTQPPTRVCGEECSDDAMCQRNRDYSKCQAVNGKKICVSTLCQDPKNTQPGANCFCQNEKGTCGQRCGTGTECQEGLTCGFINVANGTGANSCDDRENTSGSPDKGYQYCIPEISDSAALNYTSDTKYRCTDATRARRLGKWDETSKQWVFTGLTQSDIVAACTATPAPSATPRVQRVTLSVCKAIKRAGKYVTDWKTVPSATFALEITKGPKYTSGSWDYGTTFDTVSFDTASDTPNKTLPGNIPAHCKDVQNIVTFGNYSFKAEQITAGTATDWKEALYHDDYESTRTLFKYGNPATSASFREQITLGIDSNDGASRTILVVNDTDKTATPNPSSTPTPSATPIVSSSCLKTEKAAVPVCAEDKNQANITLTVDGTACGEEIQRFPLDVAIVFDRSGSMIEAGSGQPLKNTKEAAKKIMDQLDPTIDRVSLTTFAPTAKLDKAYTNDFAAMKKAIDDITSSSAGGTNIGGGIKTSLAQTTSNGRAGAKKIMIVMSDGASTRTAAGSGCSTPTTVTSCVTDSITQATTAKSAGTTIYTVGVELASKKFSAKTLTITRDAMKSIASSPEKYYDAPSSQDLSSIFAGIISEVIDNAAQNVLVKDILPEGVTYVADSAAPAPTSVQGQTLTWNLAKIKAEKKVITLKVNLASTTANQLVDVYPDSAVEYTNAQNTLVKVPFPETKVTPSECVIAPVCVNIEKDVASPVLGSQVRFTCGTVANATRYEFRYKYTDNGETNIVALDPQSDGSNLSKPVTISTAGAYKAQCRPCNSKGCSEYESL